jgi:hypothetical protein
MNRQSTSKKIEAAINNLKKAQLTNSEKQFGVWKCLECGIEKKATVHQNRKKYCSSSCVSIVYKKTLKGSNNPNYSNAGLKICLFCEKEYKNYNKKSIFCSIKCRNEYGNIHLRNNARKDNNHNYIVSLLKQGGAVVKDMSKAMNGMPDLLVWHMEKWHLIEIKNPETSYGKKGLSPSQKKFAEEWKGGPVMIVQTKEDVDKFLIGEFKDLEYIKQ